MRTTPSKRPDRRRESETYGSGSDSDSSTSPKRPFSLWDELDPSSIDAIETFAAEPEEVSMFEEAFAIVEEDEEKLREEMEDNSPAPSSVQLGIFAVKAHYSSPFPKDFRMLPKLYMCEFCLNFMKTADELTRHSEKECAPKGRGCPRHPPGDEIYRQGNLALFEVDGRKNRLYCQNLCLLGKMFLQSKTLYYEVGPFLFYVLTEWNENGASVVGFFSKEKDSFLNYNLSCTALSHRPFVNSRTLMGSRGFRNGIHGTLSVSSRVGSKLLHLC